MLLHVCRKKAHFHSVYYSVTRWFALTNGDNDKVNYNLRLCDLKKRYPLIRCHHFDRQKLPQIQHALQHSSQNGSRVHAGINRPSCSVINNTQKKTYKLNKNIQTHHGSADFSAKAFVAASPSGIQPYLQLSRVDKPIGTWLVYLPSTWAIAMAAPPGAFPDFITLGLFGVGALLMRGAGCTINDIIDKDIDRQVSRTKDRPLASGQISDLQALSFLGLQLSAALMILLSFDWFSVLLGSSSVLLVVTYPLAKRVTFWPQVFLGLTLNWGVLLGWSVVHGPGAWSVCLPLYAAGVLHTLIYDTIYAHGDKEDDRLAGVMSTALYMGDATKYWLSGFTGAMLGSLSLAGLACGQTWPYYTGVAAIGAHLAKQLWTVNLDDPADCGDKFRSNRYIGMLLFVAIITGNLLRVKNDKEQIGSNQIHGT